jgi:hypothetical protein
MTDPELQNLIATIRQHIYAWCGGEAIESVEKLIRYVEKLQKSK